MVQTLLENLEMLQKILPLLSVGGIRALVGGKSSRVLSG